MLHPFPIAGPFMDKFMTATANGAPEVQEALVRVVALKAQMSNSAIKTLIMSSGGPCFPCSSIPSSKADLKGFPEACFGARGGHTEG